MDGEKADTEAVAIRRDVIHTAFPDLRFEITAGAEEGDRYNFEATFTGTHSGPFRGAGGIGSGSVAPTGAKVKVDFAVCIRVDGDKIAAESGYGVQLRPDAAVRRRISTAVMSQP